MSKKPHQLLTHIDQHADGNVDIRYTYPFSQPHELSEQVIRKTPEEIPDDVRSAIDFLRSALGARRTVSPVRLPHQTKTPVVQDNILTVVVRDRQRKLPVIRLTYYESIEGLTRVEKQVRVEGSATNEDERAAWRKAREWAKGQAWEDYSIKTKMKDSSSGDIA